MLSAVIAAGVLTTVLFLIVRVKKGGLPAMFLKAAASVGFIAVGSVAFYQSREDFLFGMLMIMGFVFSLLGDIWLDLKYVYLKDSDIFLTAGFISFMLGHALFIPAIAGQYEEYGAKYFAISAAICAVIAGVMLLLEKPMKQNFGKFRFIVALYTFILSMTMVTAVIGMIVNGFSTKFILLAIGSAAFAASDIVLSGIYFKKGGNTSANVLVNHILYYLAQYTLASSILF